MKQNSLANVSQDHNPDASDMKNGILYGIGVGPGDPELMTLKAVRIIEESDCIAFPGVSPDECMACRIAGQVVRGFYDKTLISCNVPMTRDVKRLEECYDDIADTLEEQLSNRKDVAFLTIGDPTLYSTCMQVHRRIMEKGYTAELISGVNSFSAAAAALGISIAEREEQLHIIPFSTPINEIRNLKGTKVFMKPGKDREDILVYLAEVERKGGTVYTVSNVGLPDERRTKGIAEIPDDIGYMTMVLCQEGGN